MRSIEMKHVVKFVFFLLIVGLIVAQSAFAASVPQVASAIGRELDRQMGERGQSQNLSISITTPVDVNNLESANPLARQMQEEIARWLVQAGYNVQEVRKGDGIFFQPRNGEFLLTRRERLVGNKRVGSSAVMAGTYTVTPENVRFNIRLVETKTRAVIAMSTMTVPMTREVAALTGGGAGGGPVFGGTPIEPTVVTLLP